MQPCPYCDKTFKSYKSWHRHKTLSHPDKIGDYNPRRDYDKSPKLCLECTAKIPFEKHSNQFCSQSCAAINTNRAKNLIGFADKHRETWHRNRPNFIHSKPKRKQANNLRICVSCGSQFSSKYHQKYCHPTCNQTKIGKIAYRNFCRFNLNPRDHKSLYDFDLIKSNGWYRPSNHPDGYNPDGVTWDHLYRVEDGFKNQIDPYIMSHPANAEMLIWRENIARKQSQITLDQLYKRINDYDLAQSCVSKP